MANTTDENIIQEIETLDLRIQALTAQQEYLRDQRHELLGKLSLIVEKYSFGGIVKSGVIATESSIR